MTREIERSEWRTQSWKNLLGVTHEIWREPDREDFHIRVSLAEVTASGPFSQFPGYQRWTFLVGPAPIVLAGTELVAPGDRVVVPGTEPIDAELRAGPTFLLNILAYGQIEVGHGSTTNRVRFRFDLAQQRAYLEDDIECETAGCVWIAT